jgi:hypothetical protein
MNKRRSDDLEVQLNKALERVKFLEAKLRALQCIECQGTELKHKPSCPWRD